MDFLKAEIARKKKEIEDKSILAENKKYFKRGDLAAKEKEEYWKQNKRLKLARLGEEHASDSGSEDTHKKDDGVPGSPEEKEHRMLPRKEVIRHMRDRGEPIRLYGESDYESFLRLKKLEMLEPEINKGYNNDFKTAMDRVDQEYLDELVQSTQKGAEGSSLTDVKIKDDGTTLEEILKIAPGLGLGDVKLDCEIVLKYLKLVLRKWGEELNNRKEDAKRNFGGKLYSATHAQTVDYIKPLFRNLKKYTIDHTILDCLGDIVKQMLDRQYLKANDAYLEMAIGNAPWPIGVTMVGIHARTGREKIFARNVAHVLNDETQRKYIQAVKRLMTQAQKYFPTDPSRSVNYERS